MKKISLFLVCSLIALGAVAQQNVVDAVNKDISGFTPDYKAAREKLKPALSNDQTKDDARTWFVAGKTEFGLYDNLLGKMQLKQDVNNIEMGNALLDGYSYFLTALPLDSVAEKQKDGSLKLDKKGNPKIKTKYSKDILNLISGHFNDFQTVGNFFYDAKNFGKAYEAWDIYTSLPKAAFLGKQAPVLPDTIVGLMNFYKGIAAWQNEEPGKAVKAFADARKMGYTKKEAFDYAMSCYVNLKDNDAIVAIATEAFPLYGSQDPQYISIMINDLINKGNYAGANELLDKAISGDPQNAEFYNVKGTLYENQKDLDNAIIQYKKAIELNPEYPKGLFDVGRYYYNIAIAKRDEINELKGAAYQKALNEVLNPLYRDALPYLEKAYQLDPSNVDAKNALKNIYYFLGDADKLNAIESAN